MAVIRTSHVDTLVFHLRLIRSCAVGFEPHGNRKSTAIHCGLHASTIGSPGRRGPVRPCLRPAAKHDPSRRSPRPGSRPDPAARRHRVQAGPGRSLAAHVRGRSYRGRGLRRGRVGVVRPTLGRRARAALARARGFGAQLANLGCRVCVRGFHAGGARAPSHVRNRKHRVGGRGRGGGSQETPSTT
jgi:hypothetical protein